jgi:hypothetical protein
VGTPCTSSRTRRRICACLWRCPVAACRPLPTTPPPLRAPSARHFSSIRPRPLPLYVVFVCGSFVCFLPTINPRVQLLCQDQIIDFTPSQEAKCTVDRVRAPPSHLILRRSEVLHSSSAMVLSWSPQRMPATNRSARSSQYAPRFGSPNPTHPTHPPTHAHTHTKNV